MISTKEDNKRCLLYGGGYSIKDYYMESGNPRQMRGASWLLTECADKLKGYLYSQGVAEDQIIGGGASLSAIIPSDKADAITQEAERIYREGCRTANAAFVAVPYDDDYPSAKSNAVREYDNRRSSKFISWEFQNQPDASLEKPYIYEPERLSEAPKRCPRCRLRTPIYRVEREGSEEGPQYLCTSCAMRESVSNKTKHNLPEDFKIQFDLWEQPEQAKQINTISDLADNNGRVALLYADVNDLGGHKAKKIASTFDNDRNFHLKIKEIVENAVYKTLEEAVVLTGKNKNKSGAVSKLFEVIAIGGDDICLLIPGDVALFTAKTIADKFDEGFKDEKDNKFTISAAVCVANDTAAVSFMENIVGKLLKDTKKYARCKKQSAVGLSFLEKRGGLFPMTAYEAGEFVRLLNKAENVSSSVIRNIAEARHEMKFDEEFNLFLDYFLSRETHLDEKEVLESIRKNYSGKNPWEDFIIWRGQKTGNGGAL